MKKLTIQEYEAKLSEFKALGMNKEQIEAVAETMNVAKPSNIDTCLQAKPELRVHFKAINEAGNFTVDGQEYSSHMVVKKVK
jgi:hypothetical protein